MLFLLNRPDAATMTLVDALAPDDDKELLLISDGVYLARKPALAALAAHDFDEIYVEEQAASDRDLELDNGCSLLTMEEIVDVMLDNGKVVNL
jgi:sulfur transfer complex TusBCD TusB component (DsrH family)